VNVLSSIPPIYPSASGSSSAVTGSGVAATGNPSVVGEQPAANDTRSLRPAEQASEGKSATTTAEEKTDSEKRPDGARTGSQGLTETELKELTELKSRDREVRAHEAAHQAVGGQYAGAMSFSYQRGPDGAQYAVGGEVPIDVAPVSGDPQATIEKMRVVRAAAMAPAQPSSQDRAVAAQAMQTMLQAQSEMAAGEADSGNDASAVKPRVSGQGEDAGEARSRQASDAYRSVSEMQGYGTGSEAATSVFA